TEHRPRAGEWPKIEGFLKHVFGEAPAPGGHPRYLMAIDYLTILWTQPAHKLPILVLVNELGGTGKSTFINLLRAIFGANATYCANDDLTDSFNSSWATKLIALIDEGLIEKRVVLEKVKSMTTSPRVKLHGKGKDKVEGDLFVKFVFTSNDEDNCIPITPTERRFWVIKVPQLQGEDNPDLLDEMCAEIPAFLHHLENRDLIHKRKGQLWFAPEDLQTPALHRLIKGSKSWLEKEIRIMVREKLLDYEVDELCLSYTDIETEVCKHRRWQRWEIIKTLQDRMKIKPENSSYLRHYWVGEGPNRQLESTRDRGRFYRFHADDHLEPHERQKTTELP
ncbi:MAG: hypothetical protein D6722_12510, partial [Bacteroidetes bacterium]